MKKKKRVRKIYIDLNFSAIKLITIFPSICSIFKKEKKKSPQPINYSNQRRRKQPNSGWANSDRLSISVSIPAKCGWADAHHAYLLPAPLILTPFSLVEQKTHYLKVVKEFSSQIWLFDFCFLITRHYHFFSSGTKLRNGLEQGHKFSVQLDAVEM